MKGPHPIRRRRHSYQSQIVDSHALLSEESGSDLNQCPSNEAGAPLKSEANSGFVRGSRSSQETFPRGDATWRSWIV